MAQPTEIEARHVKQLAVMRGYLNGKEYFQAAEALEFSRRLEKGVRKDGKTPKFHHQLSIARLICTLPHAMHPEAAITAAFLHDVLEDHGETISREDLARRFGQGMADITWRLSKKYRGMTKSYEGYFEELAECPTASLVKLADRAHNLKTMPGVFSQEKQRAYLAEVSQWFYPLIRKARRNFPQQYMAYENLKILLRCLDSLLALSLEDTTASS